MKNLSLCLLFLVALAFSATAHAYTLPAFGQWYFVGTTQELTRIRAAIDKAAGFPEESWTAPYPEWEGHVLSAPWGMGAVDCLGASYAPNQGPYDGAEDYLGMSVELPDGIVEIPALEDLVNDTETEWPRECYGYLFHRYCTGWLAEWFCPDPE